VPNRVRVHVMLGKQMPVTLHTGVTLGAVAGILAGASGLIASRSNDRQLGGSMYSPACTHMQPGLGVHGTFSWLISCWYSCWACWHGQQEYQRKINQLKVPCTFKPGCNDTSLANMYMQRAMRLCCKLEMSDGDTLSVTLSRSTKTMALVTQ